MKEIEGIGKHRKAKCQTTFLETKIRDFFTYEYRKTVPVSALFLLVHFSCLYFKIWFYFYCFIHFWRFLTTKM